MRLRKNRKTLHCQQRGRVLTAVFETDEPANFLRDQEQVFSEGMKLNAIIEALAEDGGVGGLAQNHAASHV